MRWRTIDEVKAGKGEEVCANVACEWTEDLQPLEVVFGYMEEGKAKNVLVKCVVYERCRRKMRKTQGKEKESKSRRDLGEEKADEQRKRRRHHHESRRDTNALETKKQLESANVTTDKKNS
jgi:protein FRA10AC1